MEVVNNNPYSPEEVTSASLLYLLSAFGAVSVSLELKQMRHSRRDVRFLRGNQLVHSPPANRFPQCA